MFNKQPLPKLPVLQRIPTQQTKSYPLRAIFKSESTTENTQLILDDLFLHQLGLKADAKEFQEHGRIVVGDLKTLNLILSLKKQREDTAESSAYDTYRWVVPNLGLFHLRMNMLQLIHGAHWGGMEGRPTQWDDASSLQWQADAFGNSRRTRTGKEVQAVDQLIRHSYDARVTAVFVNILKSKTVTDFVHTGREIDRQDVQKWLRGQKDRRVFEWVVEQVWDRLFRQRSNVEDDSNLDDEWQNHVRFVQHVRPYLLLKWSIQHADLGLIRQAMRECCVLFQAPIGGKGNYAREMIRYLQLVDDDAVDKEIADYILLNALVNPSGKADGWYPMDQHLEFINLNIRNGLADRRSSYNKGEWIKDNVLNIPFTHALQLQLEGLFGSAVNGEHRKKSASDDVWYVANQLQSSSTISKPGRIVAYAAPDLYVEGWKAFPTNVVRHNSRSRLTWGAEDELRDANAAIPSQNHVPIELPRLVDWTHEAEGLGVSAGVQESHGSPLNF